MCDIKDLQFLTKKHCAGILCKTDEAACTYDVCQVGYNKWNNEYCKSSYQEKHPSATQFLNPDDVAACKVYFKSCTNLICGNTALS